MHVGPGRNGSVRIETRMENETVWLTQAQMCKLFDKNKRTISEHIRNIFSEGELREAQVVRKFRTTAADGKSYLVAHYNLDVIISVGYRVKSHRGTQFRIWATQRLREYIIKGFTMDDERLKQAGGGNYFDELLARIRDIRSSEKVFWRKVLDIYATSIDYNPNTDTSREFFATIQNKMHWATHGQTAAEVIYRRADSTKPNMGMTNWIGVIFFGLAPNPSLCLRVFVDRKGRKGDRPMKSLLQLFIAPFPSAFSSPNHSSIFSSAGWQFYSVVQV